MVVELDPKYEAQLKELADATGRTVQQVVNDVLDRGLNGEKVRTEDRMSDEEHAAMMEEMERIWNLPHEGPDDDLSAEDHDKIIYGMD